MNVALTGITGYAGFTLYQLLKNHPQVETINVYQHDLDEPKPLSELNPRLLDETTTAFPYDPAAVMQSSQVLFLATPAGVSSQWATAYLESDFPIIDLSGDFRLKDPALYEKWYKKVSASKANLQKAYYGLADLKQNKNQHYVANPGCYATATLLGLAPLVQQQLIEEDSILVDAKSGLSGAGKKLTAASHFEQANENLQVYKANQHQHIPEILQSLKDWDSAIQNLQFITTLVPIDRGILASIYVKPKAGVSESQLLAAFQNTYKDQPFVKVQTNGLPDVKSVINTNDCRIGLSYNTETNCLLVVSVIDNMLKGAAGQAIQNFNQLFDFAIDDGLKLNPIAF